MGDVFYYNTHLHITTWVIGIILFLVVLNLVKKSNEKAAKITHMVLRLFYIFIIVTGALLWFNNYSGTGGGMFAESIVKSLAGVWLVGAMEMVLVSTKKGKSTFAGWLQFALSLILVLALGFGRLQLGVLP
ncbi:YisL family protein [Piscibacillus sp. B03]|uniref:YisL family protein n=1 Tax=Piscibacillus sp. B03 TaxID=3457430 RepID=UPI003FCE24C8